MIFLRKKKCQRKGTHRPVIIDLGRRKMCFRCARW